jgi:hypothetical protein
MTGRSSSCRENVRKYSSAGRARLCELYRGIAVPRLCELYRGIAVPRLCELYPSICLTTEEKARENLS